MDAPSGPPPVRGLSELASAYPYLLCDVWGVLHNGLAAYPAAVDALTRYRAGGGIVVLVTNAPRPKGEVVRLLGRLGAPREAYDDIVTSGEVSRVYLAGRAGARVYHLGPERDLPLYDGLPVELSGAGEADLISCTGLFNDEVETPDDYAERLKEWSERELPMLCANPDKVVERGDRLIWCAGAIAARYVEIGGATTIIGKPYRPIYDAALARLAELAGGPVERAAVLAVGDGMETDVRGANHAGLDVLFITGGIHVELFGDREAPERARVGSVLAEAGLTARAMVPRLSW
jgi:HAD superfamily hydrolase (TIGR01459 family)